jgi:hypothetical protein
VQPFERLDAKGKKIAGGAAARIASTGTMTMSGSGAGSSDGSASGTTAVAAAEMGARQRWRWTRQTLKQPRWGVVVVPVLARSNRLDDRALDAILGNAHKCRYGIPTRWNIQEMKGLSDCREGHPSRTCGLLKRQLHRAFKKIVERKGDE